MPVALRPETAPTAKPLLSGRAMTALLQHKRKLDGLLRELHAADRGLAGALAACDAQGQLQMLADYLAHLQEVRAAAQRLEGFLLKRVGQRI